MPGSASFLRAHYVSRFCFSFFLVSVEEERKGREEDKAFLPKVPVPVKAFVLKDELFFRSANAGPEVLVLLGRVAENAGDGHRRANGVEVVVQAAEADHFR